MSIRDKLLLAFNGRPGQDIFRRSTLARQFGVSRAAVWETDASDEKCRAARSKVPGGKDTGPAGALLTALWLVRWKPSRWVIPHYFLNTPSTQTLAKAGAAAGLPEGHLWIPLKLKPKDAAV